MHLSAKAQQSEVDTLLTAYPLTLSFVVEHCSNYRRSSMHFGNGCWQARLGSIVHAITTHAHSEKQEETKYGLVCSCFKQFQTFYT